MGIGQGQGEEHWGRLTLFESEIQYSFQPQNHKFLDFEALNAQVKQTVPKVIEVLHKVLREAMETVKILDQNLMAEMRRLYSHAANAEPSLDSYLVSHFYLFVIYNHFSQPID